MYLSSIYKAKGKEVIYVFIGIDADLVSISSTLILSLDVISNS